MCFYRIRPAGLASPTLPAGGLSLQAARPAWAEQEDDPDAYKRDDTGGAINANTFTG